MRTRLDKHEIKRRRKEANVSAIDKLLQFGNYMAADDDLRQQVLSHKKPKRGQKRKMPGGGGKFPNNKKKKFTPRRK
ncbi:unnamed protein product, partial [Mesorhabditis belari]|uniref:Uncharacterized protein n=1 Tax=Mesorhabditis belari TaxID=2138241 RepID=A0AAF3EWH2_9BILA